MYGWIFRHLPGPLTVRIILALLLILTAVFILMEYVFPVLAEYSPFTETSTIE
ncbi:MULTISPECIES: hypothetical protein [unclassified Rothia (in: high G+C Gram-positive bacteria)]|uniref:hypothetical protein n=1 Tax=unclassified Rothia (in: high G+C Gram-positive bacteria) TaxID=2689056 RepID=UPI00195BFE5A|nr:MULTISPECIES: hypothetical protein [unclassified Rothia (in: high G+C Gram-positive bacteria)]MBM7052270.1 hypothetical protein [Rothia sp. ZJ1223]QRZ61530.1 hypothetical protein JR346_10010 [Rothia sp. ZJ932]